VAPAHLAAKIAQRIGERLLWWIERGWESGRVLPLATGAPPPAGAPLVVTSRDAPGSEPSVAVASRDALALALHAPGAGAAVVVDAELAARIRKWAEAVAALSAGEKGS
jgi:hypothetical protein